MHLASVSGPVWRGILWENFLHGQVNSAIPCACSYLLAIWRPISDEKETRQFQRNSIRDNICQDCCAFVATLTKLDGKVIRAAL